MIQTLKQIAFEGMSRSIASCDPQETIIVAGAPRSGTTWLAEVLRALPSYKFLNEPLFLSNNESAREAGFGWRTHIAPGDEAPWARSFFEDVLSGQVAHGPLWHYQTSSDIGRLREQVANRRLVVKFCRAGRLLQWLLGEFDVRGTVMIIRHPCAVLASQLEHGGWAPEQLSHDVDSKGALGQIPDNVHEQFSDVLEGISTRLDLMTAVWCLDYYIPLVEYADHGSPWHLMPYERLVLDGDNEMDRVLSGLGFKMTEDVRDQLTVGSVYASDDLATVNGMQQLAKWRSRLSERQINRVLDLVSAFGLDFYTRDLEPDYAQMPGL